MVKNSTSKKRNGIGSGIQKHKLRVTKQSDGPDTALITPTQIWAALPNSVGTTRFGPALHLFLLPFKANRDASAFSWASPWHLLAHYLVLSIAVVITAFRLFVTVRKTVTDELDLTVYLCACYDLICLTLLSSAMGSTLMGREMALLRLADEVLGRLQDVKSQRFYGRLEKERQMEMLRRGRALRPLSLRVGEYADFCFTVTYNIWDEILNQLLFLLSI